MVTSPVAGAAAATAGPAVVVVDREVDETVALPSTRVVESTNKVPTPVLSHAIPLSPSVTFSSGTPTSGSGVGCGVWAAECCGSANAITANTTRHQNALRTFIAVTRSIVFPPCVVRYWLPIFPQRATADRPNTEHHALGPPKAAAYYNELLWIEFKRQ